MVRDFGVVVLRHEANFSCVTVEVCAFTAKLLLDVLRDFKRDDHHWILRFALGCSARPCPGATTAAFSAQFKRAASKTSDTETEKPVARTELADSPR
jgi:hypothetical protein